MTEPLNPNPNGEPAPEETFTWTGEPGTEPGSTGEAKDAAGPTGASGRGTTATAILDSIREAVDDLAERATPTVREISAKAAELAATAADRAAPLAKRAGEATSDASGKLAERSRSWASDLRASLAASDTGDPPVSNPPAAGATDHGSTPSSTAPDAGTTTPPDESIPG